jgi:6-phosphofructokinase
VPAKNNIGILTGGGDVPGLNPVIKSVVYRAKEMGRQVIGIRKGWEGLTHMADSNEDPIYIRPLTRDNTRTIDRTGGTVLHTSRTNPNSLPTFTPTASKNSPSTANTTTSLPSSLKTSIG